MVMADSVPLTIGAEASCGDVACGQVRLVVVDPVAEAVAHVVVEPARRRDPGRLVPLDLVDAMPGEFRLHCTKAEFEELDLTEETRFMAGTSGYAGDGPGEVGHDDRASVCGQLSHEPLPNAATRPALSPPRT